MSQWILFTFGGGTPSLLNVVEIQKLLHAIKEHFRYLLQQR